MTAKFGIIPDRFYSESDLDKLAETGLPIPSRSQRDKLRRMNQWPRAAKITPGRNSTLGQHLIDMIERRVADAANAAEGYHLRHLVGGRGVKPLAALGPKEPSQDA